MILASLVCGMAAEGAALLQATAVGGAVALTSILTLNMSGNIFIGNSAGQGGGLFVSGTTTSELGIQSGR